jgi:hypothetical protein
VDAPEQALHRLPRRLGAEVGAPILAVEATDRISEEVELLLGQSGDPGLGRVHLQPETRHQFRHARHRCFCVTGSAADDEVVGIVDDVGLKSVPMAVVVPGQ